MRGLMLAGLILGTVEAVVCGTVLTVWDMSATNKSELWRMQTGSTGLLMIWMACMILYIDRLWHQRSAPGSHHGPLLLGDSVLGWGLVALSAALCATGIDVYLETLPMENNRSIPLGVIRIGLGGLILAFGASILREGWRRRQAESTIKTG
jgi:hypothetical protein